MNANLNNTMQQLAKARWLRTSVQGTLRDRMFPPENKCIVPFSNPDDRNGIQHCTQLLLKYASEENRLRQRVRRKAQIASGHPTPEPIWQLRTAIAGGGSVVFEVVEASSITGRADECDLVLPLPHISRKHAVLMPRINGLGVRDLDSSNGIFVNDTRVQYAVLYPGDTLTIGWQDFVVELKRPPKGVFVA